jgi:DNA (cytosine-5)-methyltransferase 1
MIHLDLFSGIGGFALAVDEVWPNVEHIFCEINPFCQKVLQKHWKESVIYGDIRDVNKNSLSDGRIYREPKEQTNLRNVWDFGTRNEPRVHLLTGGFPCQPFSQAGKRKGTNDNRYLWPEMLRVIQEFKPTRVVAENVRGLLTIEQGVVFEQVCLDLERENYEVQPFIIPAVAVNAPHRRDRVWFVAYNTNGGRRSSKAITDEERYAPQPRENGELEGRLERPYNDASDLSSEGRERNRIQGAGRLGQHCRDRKGQELQKFNVERWSENWLEVATELCRVDDGLPEGLDFSGYTKAGHRVEWLKSLGNAIVPQVAIEIFKAIRESDNAKI